MASTTISDGFPDRTATRISLTANQAMIERALPEFAAAITASRVPG